MTKCRNSVKVGKIQIDESLFKRKNPFELQLMLLFLVSTRIMVIKFYYYYYYYCISV